MPQTDTRNLILAFVLSMAVLLLWNLFYEQPRREAQRQAQLAAQEAARQSQLATDAGAPAATAPAAQAGPRPRTEVLAQRAAIPIETPSLHGSLSLVGQRIDDLTLARYYTTVEAKEAAARTGADREHEVVLFSPEGTARDRTDANAIQGAYFAEFGWAPVSPGVVVPGPDTRWQTGVERLVPGTPVEMVWESGDGLTFRRTITVDADYLFTVTQSVTNRRPNEVALRPYGFVRRYEPVRLERAPILHEGPIGWMNGEVRQPSYGTLRDEQEIGVRNPARAGGWVGLTDKYWLAAVIPQQDVFSDLRFSCLPRVGGECPRGGLNWWQADFTQPVVTVAPNETVSVTNHLYAGAKIASLIDRYEAQLDIPLFDRAIDWGFLYFLTRPYFWVLDLVNTLVGNFGIAILIVTVLLRGALFPLYDRQMREFARMKVLAPRMTELRDQYKDDRARLQQEIMELYKREKVNPLAGCLPILLQIPIFYALYKVLFVTIEMRHAPFFGWIRDLSAPDPTTVANLFGLIPWDPPDWMHLGAWPLLMGVAMYIQVKLQPPATDPVQQQVMVLMPIMFVLFSGAFPAGLVIYWTWTTLLGIAQQWLVMRRMKAADAARAAKAVKPAGGTPA